MQNLQQERARYALAQVKAAVAKKIDGDELNSYAARFPAMVQSNGLGQAAAFYVSQGGTYKTLYDLLSNWLIQKDQPYAGQRDLMQGITQLDVHAYRAAQAEALLLLDWVKKFCKAYVTPEKPDAPAV